MKLEQVHIAYFIGIGGIGMSALARWFRHQGITVAGYDRTPTPLTAQLATEGIAVHHEDDVCAIPASVLEDTTHSLVIYTPAVPQTHKELGHLRAAGFTVMKRSEVLGMVTRDIFTVAVAGTHGKTTTSSMIAHILKCAGRDVVAFLGGVATNYGTNLIMNEQWGKDTIAVVEADEFDRSFLTLYPERAIITSVDADHLDVYGSTSELQAAFGAFIRNIHEGGTLFLNERAKAGLGGEVREDIHTVGYGMDQGEVLSKGLGIVQGAFEFDYWYEEDCIEGIRLGIPGFHNVENALAAVAVARDLGLGAETIKEALRSYQGVKRRFEYVLRIDEVTFIDDYAHHPVEIEAFLKSLRELYPGRKLTVVFQPHLYTRTRDFAQGFADSLSLADEVILMEIYPAREQPIEGVSADLIYRGIRVAKSRVLDSKALLEKIRHTGVEVLATVGAGDIDRLVGPIKELLKKKYETV